MKDSVRSVRTMVQKSCRSRRRIKDIFSVAIGGGTLGTYSHVGGTREFRVKGMLRSEITYLNIPTYKTIVTDDAHGVV